MTITIHSSFLPHADPDASLAFYRDTLGFEVRNDVGYEGMRWITVGPPDQLGEAGAEGAERRAADSEADVGDAAVAPAQQHHRALDPPRHHVAVRRFAEGEPELAAEVPGRHVRTAGERLAVQRLGVLPVDPVADAA